MCLYLLLSERVCTWCGSSLSSEGYDDDKQQASVHLLGRFFEGPPTKERLALWSPITEDRGSA